MHSQLLEKIENNFYRQGFVKSDIKALRERYKNYSQWTAFIYGSKENIASQIKSKIKLLRRLKQLNARSIEALLKENNSKQYDTKNK